MVVLAGQVWHFWMGVLLAIPAVIAVFVTIYLYLRRVSSPRYPRR